MTDADIREQCAKLVDALKQHPILGEKPWARMALTVAARAIRRGRLLTEREQLGNLAASMEDCDDVGDTDEERAENMACAARIREMAARAVR